MSRLERVRRELPAVTRHAYLNTGTYGPLPRAADAAMRAWQEEELASGRIAPGRGSRRSSRPGSAPARSARTMSSTPTGSGRTRGATRARRR